MTERDLIRFDRIVEVNRDDQRIAVYFDVSELASLVAAARSGIALAGIADPAALRAALEDVRKAFGLYDNDSVVLEKVGIVMTLLPPETP